MQIVTNQEGILTGLREIDAQLVGGIRAGSLVLIEGPPGVGKSVLSQHLTYRALRTNRNAAVYYTIEHTVKSLIAQMDSLAMHVLDNLLADSFRVYPLRSPFSHREALKAIYLLTSHISKLPERFNLVVIDSVTPFIAKLRPAAKSNFFRDCKKLCNEYRIIILVANPHIFDKKTFPRIKVACDYHMTLKLKAWRFQPDRPEERIINKMRIPKLHGADLDKRPGIRFEIEPKVGIEVVPFGKFRV